MPESKRHLTIRTFLYQVLRLELRARCCIGSEQFVYWNARDPRLCLAPDAFVKLGAPDCDFDSWKTWERGAPELCVEITSPSDADASSWADKLARYHELGAQEIMRFDPDAAPGERLRVWDRLDEDLVEREITADTTPCTTLGLWFVVQPVEEYPVGLGLARDADGRATLQRFGR